MFKLKSPIKKLSLATALAVIASTASATPVTVYDTYKYLSPSTSGSLNLDIGEWGAGYVSVSRSDCPNGCDITGASLLLEGALYEPLDDVSFEGVTLEIYSSQGSVPVPGASLFQLDTPETVRFDGTFGTRIQFTAARQDADIAALLQPGEEYWLKLTNVDQSPAFAWLFYDELNAAGEYWAASKYGHGSGLPFIFDVTGDARAISEVPIPGAVWLMGSALFGLLATARRKAG